MYQEENNPMDGLKVAGVIVGFVDGSGTSGSSITSKIFSYTGNGFLYNMVRILTGTLVEVGLGKRKPEEMKNILAAMNREAAGMTAPPEGLFLESVEY